MSAREWKPGDVAMVSVRGADPVIAIRDSYGWAHNTLGPGRAHAHWTAFCEVEPIHPLVVIDPEDREQVERLMSVYVSEALDRGAMSYSGHVDKRNDSMQAALREFATPTPPKPDEPQGLGAVVEDAAGHLWVKVPGEDGTKSSQTWTSAHSTDATWDAVAAVRVLSEGVTS